MLMLIIWLTLSSLLFVEHDLDINELKIIHISPIDQENIPVQ
jgi:hypothetical protein